MKLNEYRNEIDKIDQELKELFLKRLKVVKEIAILKRKENIPIIDEKREEEMFTKHKESFSNLELWTLYEKFLKSLIEISKEVQK